MVWHELLVAYFYIYIKISYHKKGLLQLGEYLEQYGLEEGYLLVFDFRKESNRLEGIEESRVEVNGKKKRIVEAFC